MNLSQYHLTSHPWQPLGTPRIEYIRRCEDVARVMMRFQNENGAIIDPYPGREHQYATPYYAHAVGAILRSGSGADLLTSGLLAMDWATRCFELNETDGHRVFYAPPLVLALELYQPHVPDSRLQAWRKRLSVPVAVEEAYPNNWMTYLMKGEWLRAMADLVDVDQAGATIEHLWHSEQRDRIQGNPQRLYHDRTSDPDTLSVEAVGRGNLLALVEAGYDGPSAVEIREAVEHGTLSSLLLQDPSGQVPCNGRTENHVFPEIGYMLGFEVEAANAARRGDLRLAGQLRRAARLGFDGISRWLRTEPNFLGSYSVTKNHFDPAMRVGYQNASQFTNYNGAVMYHLAEAFEAAEMEIAEAPTPAEIGGYAFELDGLFATAFANAGGMQLQIDLRGDTVLELSPHYWSALGVVRMGRAGWDICLGPSDGIRSGDSGLGVSFAPTFYEDGQWIRLASVPERYQGKFSVEFTHPLLVRCAVIYELRTGYSGPSFRQEFVITPDGILSSVSQINGEGLWGITVPLLIDDGLRQGIIQRVPGMITLSMDAGSGDRQNFLFIGGSPQMTDEDPIRSSYGDLLPVRVTNGDAQIHIFVYPSTTNDPLPSDVYDSFTMTQDGFSSILGTVHGSTYTGRTSAGGAGTEFDIDGNGAPEVTLSNTCGVVIQLDHGRIVAMEADKDVAAAIDGQEAHLKAFTPNYFE